LSYRRAEVSPFARWYHIACPRRGGARFGWKMVWNVN
jgi:hypothetical protein